MRLRLPSGEYELQHEYADKQRTDTVYNPCADGTNPTLPSSSITINKVSYSKAWCDASKGHVQLDNYGLARKNNITLRLDELNSGVSTLLQTASTTAQSTVFATPPKVPIFDLLNG